MENRAFVKTAVDVFQKIGHGSWRLVWIEFHDKTPEVGAELDLWICCLRGQAENQTQRQQEQLNDFHADILQMICTESAYSYSIPITDGAKASVSFVT
jgi:hypothetical protein